MRELGRCGLADHDGACRPQPRDGGDIRFSRRSLRHQPRTPARRQAGDVEDVLDADRHAGKRSRVLAARDGVGKLGRARIGALIVDRCKGIEPLLQHVHALQDRAHGRARIALPAAVLARERGRIRERSAQFHAACLPKIFEFITIVRNTRRGGRDGTGAAGNQGQLPAYL
jgi:hypothetical protein